jgi:hypothetical protein
MGANVSEEHIASIFRFEESQIWKCHIIQRQCERNWPRRIGVANQSRDGEGAEGAQAAH